MMAIGKAAIGAKIRRRALPYHRHYFDFDTRRERSDGLVITLFGPPLWAAIHRRCGSPRQRAINSFSRHPTALRQCHSARCFQEIETVSHAVLTA
jgi:hypothetical protein